MMSSGDVAGLQLRTLRLYGELLALGEMLAMSWPGKLVLAAGTGCSQTGLGAAACIAGATCLVVEADGKRARAALREGGVDFVVNTLDEALRVLKNEVRQKRPVGVALVGDPAAVRAEMLERGVVPDVTVNAAGAPGRVHVEWSSEASELLREWLARRCWREELVEAVPEFAAGDVRAAWVRGIGRYQRSAAREARWVWA